MVRTIKKTIVKEHKNSTNACEKKWNLLPLRIALGLLFIAAGLPKLIGLILGTSDVPAYFASLHIPFPEISSWAVALIETIGGIFLIIGFLTFTSSSLLVAIMLVAIISTTLSPINYLSLAQHIVYVTGLIAIMFGKKYLHLHTCECSIFRKH